VVNARRPSDLPILDELGAEFRRLVARELGLAPEAATPEAGAAAPAAEHAGRTRVPERGRRQPVARDRSHDGGSTAADGGRARAARPPAPRRRGGAHAPRVARRTGIVLMLVCLVGTAAFAARVGLGGPGAASDSDPVVLGRGGAWELSGHRHQDRLCLLVEVAGDLADACGARPGSRGVRATSVVGRERLVAGFAGAEVARVRVEVAGHVALAATHAPADAGAAAGAGVPARLRWFVAVVRAHGAARAAPARVVPLDDAGARVGPAVLDCSASVVGDACEHLARRAARRVLEDHRHG
jgi:hypothetical protein